MALAGSRARFDHGVKTRKGEPRKHAPQLRVALNINDGARASGDMLVARDKRVDVFARAGACDPNVAVLGDPPPEFSALAKKPPLAPRGST
jgi:hypothetical protein